MRMLIGLLLIPCTTYGWEHQLGWEHQVVADLPSRYSFSVLSVDLDHDGDIDLVTPEILQFLSSVPDANGEFACEGTATHADLYWYENVGYRSFVKRAVDTNQQGWYERSHVADLNGDGRLDIVVGDNTGRDLIIYYRDGSGWTRHRQSTPVVRLYDIKSGDFNGDGRLDLVVGGYASSDVTVFVNPGEIVAPWPSFRIAGELPQVRGLQVTDVDGNGRPDILVMASLGNEISIFLTYNNSRIPFGPGTFVKTVVQSEWAPFHGGFAQIEAGGAAEIVVAHGDPLNQVAYYSLVNWFEPWAQTVVGQLPSAIDATASDIDGDGDVDIAAVAHSHVPGGDMVVWWENAESGWRRWHIGHAVAANQVQIADMDGDGRKDVVTIQDTGNGCPRQAGASRLSVWYQ